MLQLDLLAYENFDLSFFLYNNIELAIFFIINIVHLVIEDW